MERWLEAIGLGRYAEAFRAHGVDADVLPDLTGEDLREIGVTAVGHRRRILAAIAEGAAKAAVPPETVPEPHLRDLCLGGSPVETLLSRRTLGTELLFGGRFPEAREQLEGFFADYRPEEHDEGLARFGTSHHAAMSAIGLAEIAAITCDDVGALKWASRASALAEDRGRAHDLRNVTLFGGCVVPALQGRFDGIPAMAAKLRTLARDHALPIWETYADIFDSAALLVAGDVEDGLRIGARGIAGIPREATFLSFCALFRADACLRVVLPAAARDCLGRIGTGYLSQENWLTAEIGRIKGLIAHAEGAAPARVTGLLATARSVAVRQGAVLFEAKIAAVERQIGIDGPPYVHCPQ